VVRARQFPPYSRAAATVFHRLPVHGVSVIVNGARNLRKTQAACAAGTLLLVFAVSLSFSLLTSVLLVEPEFEISNVRFQISRFKI
jgi:hypothetical protein